MPKVKWTKDKLDFMAMIIPGHSEKEIRALFLEKYGIELTESQIGNTKTRLGIKSGTKGGQFKKGQAPFNKGKTWDELGYSQETRKAIQSTCFKRGSEPWNGKRVEVGTERISKDGYIEVKVKRFSDRPGMNKCWRPKHHLIWEQANGKQVPASTQIVFADGNKRNFNPDNLVAVSRSDWSVICHQGMKYSDRDTLLAAVDIAKLRRGIRGALTRDRSCKSCGETFKPRFPNQKTCDRCLGRTE